MMKYDYRCINLTHQLYSEAMRFSETLRTAIMHVTNCRCDKPTAVIPELKKLRDTYQNNEIRQAFIDGFIDALEGKPPPQYPPNENIRVCGHWITKPSRIYLCDLADGHKATNDCNGNNP